MSRLVRIFVLTVCALATLTGRDSSALIQFRCADFVVCHGWDGDLCFDASTINLCWYYEDGVYPDGLDYAAGGSGGPPAISVDITHASLQNNQISVTLKSHMPETRGELVLYVQGPLGFYTAYAATLGPGNHLLPAYGDLNSIPEEQTYTTAQAVWRVGEEPHPKDEHPFGFRVLGNYRHSQYVTVRERTCSGDTRSALVRITTDCNDVFRRSYVSSYLTQVLLNGSGWDFFQAFVHQPEGWCGNSEFAEGLVPAPTGSSDCGMEPVDNSSLARDWTDTNIACHDSIWTVGHGIKRINDRCPACVGVRQLDNYNSVSGDNCSKDYRDLVNPAKTIRLR